jgi:hypothetical protein
VVIFFIYFILCGTTILLRRLYFDYLDHINCTEVQENYTRLLERCRCAYLEGSDGGGYYVSFVACCLSSKQTLLYTASHEAHILLNCFIFVVVFISIKARLVLETIVVAYSIAYLVMIARELYIQGLRLYIKTLSSNLSKVLFLFSLLTLLLIIPMRFFCNTQIEDVLVVLSIIFKSSYILYLGRYYLLLFSFF